jgi:hypothetical protein
MDKLILVLGIDTIYIYSTHSFILRYYNDDGDEAWSNMLNHLVIPSFVTTTSASPSDNKSTNVFNWNESSLNV